ncbi:hypothetical protein GCM10027162_28400 [Streptomyces incanus]
MLRTLGRDTATAQALFDELVLTQGADTRLGAAVTRLKDRLAVGPQAGARRLVEQMALTLQGSLLVRYASAAVAEAFCATRLGGDWGHAFGTLPDGADLGAILGRALPGGD